MRILIAPDKFKDAASASDVTEAMAAGIREVLPNVEVRNLPLADGGENSGRLLASALGYEEHIARVSDARGRPSDARWWLSPARDAAIVELSEAAGIQQLPPADRNPLQTTTHGVGQLMAAAILAGAKHLTVCVGGSATVDGGAGCLQALGFRLLDDHGRVLAEPACGVDLSRIAGMRPPDADNAYAVTVLHDVSNPLLGANGAARVFGPQKGATPAAVEQLEAGMTRWAAVLSASTGRAVAEIAGTGAAGGIPAGLAAAVQARLAPGFDEIARRIDLDAQIRWADWIFTGEGRIDRTTAEGKVVASLAARAAGLGKPVVAFAGQVGAPGDEDVAALIREIGLLEARAIGDSAAPLEQRLPRTVEDLKQAAARFARERLRTQGD